MTTIAAPETINAPKTFRSKAEAEEYAFSPAGAADVRLFARLTGRPVGTRGRMSAELKHAYADARGRV